MTTATMKGVTRWTALTAFTLWASVCGGATYWVAPDGDDAADGRSADTAWASPSRGTATRVVEPGLKRGETTLKVVSTEGFRDAGRISVAGETRAYKEKTVTSFMLVAGFNKDIPLNARVYDADILGGDGFDPGDIINLRGGTYRNRPLHFYKSGRDGRPITYRSAPGERAILMSEDFKTPPIRHLGGNQQSKTEYIALKNLVVRNAAAGNHGAPGIQLYGVNSSVVAGCDVDISGRDINGDNNAIQLANCYGVTVQNCRLRSKYANGLWALKSSGIVLKDSVIYECFNGVLAHGPTIPGHIKVDHCTFYHTNRYSGANAQAPGTIEVTNSILVEMPHLEAAALAGNGKGDFNLLWHNATNYARGWNGEESGAAGVHDVHKDPKFTSLNPSSPYFLRIPKDSPAASAGKDGTYAGAFAPVAAPPAPEPRVFNVRDYGALGDGVHDDTEAINKAVEAAGAAGGGKITFPATGKHYLLSNSVGVHSSRIHLSGPGATLKMTPEAGRLYHVIDVSGTGPTGTVVEDIVVEGFTLDGTFSNPVGPLHQRGLWVTNASGVTARNLTIRNVYCGLTFGPGTRNCDAIDVTVTNWDHDGFGASARGINGGCTDVRFIRCKAVDTPRCVKAWEIEEGAQRVYLEDCRIENLGGTGTGFYVRHHAYRWPLLVDDVEFVRCSVSNISGQGFLIVTVPLSKSAIRPYIRTRNVRLIDCTSDAPVTIGVGVEEVKVQGGRFGALMGIGLYAAGSEREPLANAPARSVTIEDATVREIRINANTGNGSGALGDKYCPDYTPRIRLNRVTVPEGVQILGPEKNVVMEACRIGARKR